MRWPWTTVHLQAPSCDSRLDHLESRIRALEERATENHLKVLDYAEKLSRRLVDRIQKREQEAEGQEALRSPVPRTRTFPQRS